ncbi:hypothetical protein VTO42DRAFT_6590 [Malbranchea cinnamomea]
MFLSLVTAALSLFTVQSQAWETTVHNQIAFMAEEFLTHRTRAILGEILEPEWKGSIGRAGAWADDYAHTDEGAYSAQWHYINPADNPPAYCNIYYNRDCTKGGCIVQAIANHTMKLAACVEDVKRGRLRHGSDPDCAMALKFIAHFVGDIAQPLHVSGIAAGGNGIEVRFGGKETNLHSVWDDHIIWADANTTTGFSNKTIDPFFRDLVHRIKKDTFFIPTEKWIECVDPSTPIMCALSWARDTNDWNCDYVFSQVINGTDLLESGYATGAFPIVELQVSKAAYRLGSFLNNIVFGHWKHDREVILQTNPSWAGGPSEGR